MQEHNFAINYELKLRPLCDDGAVAGPAGRLVTATATLIIVLQNSGLDFSQYQCIFNAATQSKLTQITST